jgi:hypothetical protein
MQEPSRRHGGAYRGGRDAAGTAGAAIGGGRDLWSLAERCGASVGARPHRHLRAGREYARRGQLSARSLRVLALHRRYREGGAARDLGRDHQPQSVDGARRHAAGRHEAAGSERSRADPDRAPGAAGGAFAGDSVWAICRSSRAAITVPLRELGGSSGRGGRHHLSQGPARRSSMWWPTWAGGWRRRSTACSRCRTWWRPPTTPRRTGKLAEGGGNGDAFHWLGPPAGRYRLAWSGPASGPSPSRPSATWARPSWWRWC